MRLVKTYWLHYWKDTFGTGNVLSAISSCAQFSLSMFSAARKGQPGAKMKPADTEYADLLLLGTHNHQGISHSNVHSVERCFAFLPVPSAADSSAQLPK